MKPGNTVRTIAWSIITAGALLAADPALALRCKSKLLSEGDPQGKVLKYCGEPGATLVRSVYRAGFPRARFRVGTTESRLSSESELLIADRAYEEVVVEEWTYNFGPRRLMRRIRFENGLIRSITQLGYGYL
jgi:hypothetical protein